MREVFSAQQFAEQYPILVGMLAERDVQPDFFDWLENEINEFIKLHPCSVHFEPGFIIAQPQACGPRNRWGGLM